MDCPHSLCSYLAIKCLHRCFESFYRADVVTGCEGVSRIEANSEGQVGTGRHNCSQVLKPVANALTLARGVFQENPNRTQIESVGGVLQTLSAGVEPIRFACTAGATWMNYEVICLEKNSAFELFSKGGARLLEHPLVSSG